MTEIYYPFIALGLGLLVIWCGLMCELWGATQAQKRWDEGREQSTQFLPDDFKTALGLAGKPVRRGLKPATDKEGGYFDSLREKPRE